jgi:magnesium transporter
VLNVYRITPGCLEKVDAASVGPDSEERYWLDLINPGPEDRSRIEQARGVKLPGMDELREIQATSRFFVDENGIHLRTWLLEPRGAGLESHSAGFILSDGCLISLRAEPSESFDLLGRQRKLGVGADGPIGVFLRLVEIQLDLLADRLESVYSEAETHWPIPKNTGLAELETELGHVSRMGSDNNKARFSLMDLDLVLAALDQEEATPDPLQHRLDAVRRDVDSLLRHSGFLSHKLDFLMDFVMTRLNLVDNRISKILSVVALVFLPPTLIGSIYGMNFDHMPELASSWGYPVALLAMAATAVVPYLVLKRKRWL